MSAPKPFNPHTVSLGKRNLIEASAGTGKTYSVAVLVLRLVVLKDVPIERILMVTFTNSAVAELELRIRKFVRLGLRYAREGKETEKDIMQVIKNTDREIAVNRLQKAVQSLDQLSILTIHAFCQRTISEFTFETNQSFEYEILQDDNALLSSSVFKFIREYLNTIENYDLFTRVWKNIELKQLSGLLRRQIDGMELLDYPADEAKSMEELTDDYEAKISGLRTFVENNRTRILETPASQNNLRKFLENDEHADIEGFIKKYNQILDQKEAERPKFFRHFGFMNDEFVRLNNEISDAVNEVTGSCFREFYRRSGDEIRKIKNSRGYIAFDDQIKTIHNALKNPEFCSKLSAKFDAVFIDEFQDTDKLQYEIFTGIFPGERPMFFIGDPKQSIYGWRKADLDTYGRAKESVGERVHSMTLNFRSTEKYIRALELILNPADGYNIFDDPAIRFEKVSAGSDSAGVMRDGGKEAVPLSILEFDTNDFKTNIGYAAREVLRLLNGNATIKGNKVKPSDIAILVREGKEGDRVKAALAEYNIPSVKRDDQKVLLSDEAMQIQYLIRAVMNPRTGDISRALYSKHFGFTLEKIRKLDDAKHLEIFLDLRKTLKEEGIYNMISGFLDAYGIRTKCINDVLGQRVLTNIAQVAEILHRAEKKYRYSPEELLTWMKRSAEESEDEFEQRIESDEDAVQISTIHKCKGLTYKIVFAPFLSMIPKFKLLEKGNVNDFKKEGKYYITLDYYGLSEDDQALFDRQKEQENRRLIYVALTRAVYKCYVSLVPREYGLDQEPVDSSLLLVLNHFDRRTHEGLIDYTRIPGDGFEKSRDSFKKPSGDTGKFDPRKKPVNPVKNTFGIHSYSELNRGAHIAAPFEKAQLGAPEDYDQFIFQDLGRGASVGTALHAIFERLDFEGDRESWEKTLQEASKYWKNIIKEEKLDLFMQMVRHVMNAQVPLAEEGFPLRKIKSADKLPELEFYFSLDRINKEDINNLLGEEADLSGKVDIEGLMTGFIDLLFEHNGKYYILDWKSNHLGNSTESYDAASMEAAMKNNNYDLQYMIYTVAVTRWLRSRMPAFDYEKHFGGIIYVFLRGVRENGNTGIYVTKPEKEVIDSLDAAMKNSERKG